MSDGFSKIGRNRRNGLPGRSLLDDEEWRVLSDALGLSSRELQLIHGVLGGQRDSSIAEDLGISTHTVRTHFERLYRKLEITSRSELIVRIFAEYVSQQPSGLASSPGRQ